MDTPHIAQAQAATLCRVAVFLVILVLLGGCMQSSSEPQAMDFGAVLSIGMTQGKAVELLRQQSGDPEAEFITEVCAIPLGLDFHDGARIWTTDSGLRLSKALGWPALFFYGGKLFAVRYDLDEPSFLGLARRYERGRYVDHTFPDEHLRRKVFVAEDGGNYVFTNRHGDLYIMDDDVRRTIMSTVSGSYCWHAKLFSPNLRKFIGPYVSCLARDDAMTLQLLDEDWNACVRYCRNTPRIFSSEQCLAICQEAADRGRDILSTFAAEAGDDPLGDGQ